MARSRIATAPPAGLVYEPRFLAPGEERALLNLIETLAFQPIVMKGVIARRTAVRFGMGYDYNQRVPTADADPLPEWLLPIRDRGAELAGLAGAGLAQVLIQRYPPGAPIGWHRDSPAFELVVGVSLLSEARMRFRRGPSDDRETWEVLLEPGSAYVLAGEVRWLWEHHVPPAKELRYSVTFRSLRDRAPR